MKKVYCSCFFIFLINAASSQTVDTLAFFKLIQPYFKNFPLKGNDENWANYFENDKIYIFDSVSKTNVIVGHFEVDSNTTHLFNQHIVTKISISFNKLLIQSDSANIKDSIVSITARYIFDNTVKFKEVQHFFKAFIKKNGLKKVTNYSLNTLQRDKYNENRNFLYNANEVQPFFRVGFYKDSKTNTFFMYFIYNIMPNYNLRFKSNQPMHKNAKYFIRSRNYN